jgi:hypothetical protein
MNDDGNKPSQTSALISWHRMQLCGRCGEMRKDHMDDGHCLFLPFSIFAPRWLVETLEKR